MANAELIASARRAQTDANIALRAQAKANERAEELQKERDRLWNENVNLSMDNDLLKSKLKKFDKMLVGGSKPIKVTSETKLTKGQREAHKKSKK